MLWLRYIHVHLFFPTFNRLCGSMTHSASIHNCDLRTYSHNTGLWSLRPVLVFCPTENQQINPLVSVRSRGPAPFVLQDYPPVQLYELLHQDVMLKLRSCEEHILITSVNWTSHWDTTPHHRDTAYSLRSGSGRF